MASQNLTAKKYLEISQHRTPSEVKNTSRDELGVCHSHRLCQVTGLIDVEASHDSNVAAQELQRDDVQHWLQRRISLGNLSIAQSQSPCSSSMNICC